MSLKCVIRRFITTCCGLGTAILRGNQDKKPFIEFSQLIGQLQNHLTHLQCKLIRAKRHDLQLVMCIIRNLLITLYVSVKQLKYVPSVFCALQTYEHHPNSRTVIICSQMPHWGYTLCDLDYGTHNTLKETGNLVHAQTDFTF